MIVRSFNVIAGRGKKLAKLSEEASALPITLNPQIDFCNAHRLQW